MMKSLRSRPAKICIGSLITFFVGVGAIYYHGAGICRIRLLKNGRPLSGARVEVIGGAFGQPGVLHADGDGWIDFGWRAFDKREVAILKVVEPANVQIEGLFHVIPGFPREFDYAGSNTVIVTERPLPFLRRTITQVETKHSP